MANELVGQLIIYIVVLLLSISAHEAAHAWMSYKFGDDTAYLLGRVTLNPVKHTDPVGTLLIPIINFVAAAGAGIFVPLIGWGKPTPVNPLRWRNKDTANIMVSLAGIMANLLLAIIAFAVLKVLLVTGTLGGEGSRLGSFDEPVLTLLFEVLTMNVSLAVFNLFPIPPLDGSKILYSILPAAAHDALDALERYSYIILIAAIYFGVVRAVVTPIIRFLIIMLQS
jgi:Zn-dependent protease